MSDIIKMINPSTMDSNNIGTDLYGDKFIKDLRSAGDVAQESGARFESITLDVLNFCNNGRYNITKKPYYENHWKLDNREGDFLISSVKRKIHIECKQLGNAESHYDKLSHCLMNLIMGCYGKEYWLVYDYNREMKNKNKIQKLITRCQEVKEQVAIQGMTFECVHIDDLPIHLEQV